MEVDFVWRTLKYLNKKGIKSWCKTDKYFSGDDPSLDGRYSFYVFYLAGIQDLLLAW